MTKFSHISCIKKIDHLHYNTLKVGILRFEYRSIYLGQLNQVLNSPV